MGFIQKDALRTMVLNYLGMVLGYINKGVLFLVIFQPEQYGLINLILSVGILFAHLSNLGSINAIMRFLPFFRENEDQKQGFLLLNILFVMAGILLFSSLVIFLQESIIELYSEKSLLFVNYYFWIIPIGIANVFFLVFESYLRAIYKNILSVFLYEFVLRFATTILLVLCWFSLIDFNQFLILHTLLYFIPSLVLLIYLFRINELRFRKTTFKISRKFKKIILYFSLFSYTNTIGILVVTTMDALMIAYYDGLASTGIYTTVIYFVSALQIPYKSLIRISASLIPQYWKERNTVEMKNLYQKVSSLTLIMALFIFLSIWINRNQIAAVLPEEFQVGIWVFFFLIMGRIIDMYFGLNAYILVTSKKYKYDILFTFILIVGVYLLNVWLIPKYGIVGAAISTGLIYVLYNFARLIFVWYQFKMHPFEIKQLWVILLFFAVFGGMELIPSFIENPFIEIIFRGMLSSIIFIGVIYKLDWNGDIKKYLLDGTRFLTKKMRI